MEAGESAVGGPAVGRELRREGLVSGWTTLQKRPRLHA